jgi:hypothetical protein
MLAHEHHARLWSLPGITKPLKRRRLVVIAREFSLPWRRLDFGVHQTESRGLSKKRWGKRFFDLSC